MALELFKPFIMARLVERKAVQNIKAAKKMVESEIPEVWDVLEEVIHEHPVLLNRAPTLHRLGIQAFEPILVEGKAIQVHPLVCHAFNADFDGDQMAVHVPLSAEAQAEARILMLSSNNILSPAHGAPLATPTQDMVLGIYYLTYGPTAEELAKLDEELKKGKGAKKGPRPKVFRSAQEAELAYENGSVRLHDHAEYRREGHEHFLTTVGRIIFNDRIERALEVALDDEWKPESYEFVNHSLKKRDVNETVSDLVDTYGAPAISLVLDAFKDLGFHFATQAGITISKNNVVSPPDKDEILERYEAQAEEIHGQYNDGYITQEERREAVTSRWNEATDVVGKAMEGNLDELNPIYMMANSGARGSFKQIRQLAGMRGLMANPKGEIIERPIKANFMEGLSVLEYFISTHGARKGLADTALRTADSGYLTRRLVDVAQDVIVRIEDCKTKDHIEMPIRKPDGSLNDYLIGRLAAKKFETKRGRELLKRNEEIDAEKLDELAEALDEDDTVPVRSALKCEAESGICRSCYGIAPATGAMVDIGDAVGIIAAQSIGEPGTQLTMRTFHTGGVAGQDITQGLPRVVELFEARKPKGLAQLAEHAGKVAVEETDKAVKVTITDSGRRGDLALLPGPLAPARRPRREGRGRPAAQRGLPLPGRPAGDPRPHRDRGLPGARGAGRLPPAGRRHQRQAHRADRAADAAQGRGRVEGLHLAAAGPARGPPEPQAPQQGGQGRGRHPGQGQGADPRHHQGLAGHRVVPLGRLLPGDHQGPHRRCAGGQARPTRRAQGERDHRQADPGGDRAQALPHAGDRALRADRAPQRGGPARRGRAGRRAGARGRRRRRHRELRPLLRRGARGAGAGDRVDDGRGPSSAQRRCSQSLRAVRRASARSRSRPGPQLTTLSRPPSRAST